MPLFKTDPSKRLKKAYNAKLRDARDAQRGGDIQTFAALTQEADALYKTWQEAERETASRQS